MIKNKRRLLEALQQFQALTTRRNIIEQRLAALRLDIISFYDRKNKSQFVDEEGNIWKRLQGSTVIYDDVNFKKLLKRRGVDITTVYHQTVVEERDEQAIAKLLREKKIKVKEWKRHATIHYHNAYVRRFDPPKVKDGNTTDET